MTRGETKVELKKLPSEIVSKFSNDSNLTIVQSEGDNYDSGVCKLLLYGNEVTYENGILKTLIYA